MLRKIALMRSRAVRGIERRVMGTITSVNTHEPVAALTFDDGPDLVYTSALLDLLARHSARGTFFMIGKNAAAHPELVRAVAEAGHAIGNHTWDHPSFRLIPATERKKQLSACAQALGPYDQRLFRPPYGSQSRASRFTALRQGYQVVTWNVHIEDWATHPAAWMAERLTQQISPGCIILLHDALWKPRFPSAINRLEMLAALDLALEQLAGKYRFVTVPELLRYGRPVLENWYQASE